MFTPQTSKHFTKYVNESNGVEFYVLTTHVAPIQQGFYFVNSGYSDDGRYLYFYCAYPPALGHSLGVVDFLTDEVYALSGTSGTGSVTMVDPKTGNAWYGQPDGIYCRAPQKDAEPQLMIPWPQYIFDAEIIGYSTHFTFNPDQTQIFADIATKKGNYLGSFQIDTGEFTEWYHSPPENYFNHAQFSPIDSDTALCAWQHCTNLETGETYDPPLNENGKFQRLQIVRRNGGAEMHPAYGTYVSHEWWAPNGDAIYYVDNNDCYTEKLGDGGSFRHHLILRKPLDSDKSEIIADLPIKDGVGCWHAHCSQNEKYFVTDGSYPSYGEIWWRGCPSLVRFWNNETKKVLDICTLNPVAEGWTLENPSPYHTDPHPRFVLHDSLVCFTTTVFGKVELALAPVQQLIDATK